MLRNIFILSTILILSSYYSAYSEDKSLQDWAEQVQKNNWTDLEKHFKNFELIPDAAKHIQSMKQSQLSKDEFVLPKLIVFVSFSMPEKSLVELQTQIKSYGGLLVLRGLKENSFKKTVAYIHETLGQESSLIIDPRLFEIFQVKVAPTFVLQASNPIQECKGNDCRYVVKEFDKISGNITVHSALEIFAREGQHTKELAQKLLDQATLKEGI